MEDGRIKGNSLWQPIEIPVGKTNYDDDDEKDERKPSFSEPFMTFTGEIRDDSEEKESDPVSYEEAEKAFTKLKECPSEDEDVTGVIRKIDWKAYLTCGNCEYYRELNVSEDERKAYESQNVPIPKVCGAYPPTVMMVVVPLGGLSPEAGKMVQKPQNFWPFPPANEPSCILFQASKPHSDFLVKGE